MFQYSVRFRTKPPGIFPLTVNIVQRSVLPNTYDWLVSATGNIVTGEYQLGLIQQGTEPGNAAFIWSPRFIINVPAGSPMSFTSAMTTLPPAASTDIVPAFPIAAAGTGAVSTVTLTYVFWDHQCGCTKTQTAASPLNTAMAATTYSWFEDECSCTKSAVVPVSTIPTTWTNYTAPLNPPVPTGSNVSPMGPAGTVSSKTMGTVPFNGGNVRTSSSMLGLVALIAAAVFT